MKAPCIWMRIRKPHSEIRLRSIVFCDENGLHDVMGFAICFWQNRNGSGSSASSPSLPVHSLQGWSCRRFAHFCLCSCGLWRCILESQSLYLDTRPSSYRLCSRQYGSSLDEAPVCILPFFLWDFQEEAPLPPEFYSVSLHHLRIWQRLASTGLIAPPCGVPLLLSSTLSLGFWKGAFSHLLLLALAI